MSNTQQQIETAYLTGLEGAKEWAELESGPCQCIVWLASNKEFIHSADPDAFEGLGSTFDDFGWIIYHKDGKEVNRLWGHKHLGVIHSYSHCIRDVDPGEYKDCYFEEDNSLIPEIRQYILQHH